MRQSSRSIGTRPQKPPSTSPRTPRNPRPVAESDTYYCHYRNAMYMGGMKTFQKHGRGVVIHDDGTSAITMHLNDLKHGHNVFYKENCIMSMEYVKNRMAECVVRVPEFMLLIRYDREQVPEGKAVLISYIDRMIYYVLYRRGKVVSKQSEKDQAVINQIFDLDNIDLLIGDTHTRPIKFDIEKNNNIACQHVANKFYVGFYRKGFMNGLGFILLTRGAQSSPGTVPGGQLHLRPAERGYFYNNQLNGMGERWFKNGNYYIGDFKAGVFDGYGMLKNEDKSNWVYGTFEAGNIHELLTFSHEGDTKKLQKVVLAMHERKNNWICNEFEIPDHRPFLKQIENILASNPGEHLRQLKEKKAEVLKRIQSNFMLGDEQNTRDFSSRNLTQRNPVDNKDLLGKSNAEQPRLEQKKNKINSFIPQQFAQRTRKSLRMFQASSDRSLITYKKSKSPQNLNIKWPSQPDNTGRNHISGPLDSKRIINRSRIFKNEESESSEELPKFNYYQK